MGLPASGDEVEGADPSDGPPVLASCSAVHLL